jgi:hypothetical protein
MIKRVTIATLTTLALAAPLAVSPAHAGCYEQRTFTGREGGIYDIPGGQLVGRWYGKLFDPYRPDKINVHSTWNDSWIGGNVYMWDNTRRATGYVLKQYTEHTRWIC